MTRTLTTLALALAMAAVAGCGDSRGTYSDGYAACRDSVIAAGGGHRMERGAFKLGFYVGAEWQWTQDHGSPYESLRSAEAHALANMQAQELMP